MSIPLQRCEGYGAVREGRSARLIFGMRSREQKMEKKGEAKLLRSGRKRDELDRYAERMIEQMLNEKRGLGEEMSDEERLRTEHRNNQRRFEYDYEEDFYEPLYEDDEN